MKNKFLQYTFLSCSLMVLFSACRKDPFKGTETLSSGKSYVYITEANGSPYTQYFDVFNDIKTVVLFTIRRDAANSADLQKAVTVTLTADADSSASSGLTAFTSDLYTFPTAADIASGGVYAGADGISVNSDGTQLTVKFAPGQFAKNVIYKVDGSKLDLSKTYGAVYKITSLSSLSQKVGYSVVAAAIAVKNAYDGNYNISGTVQRYVAGGDAEVGSLNGTIVAGKTSDVITNGPTSNFFSIYWADGSGVGGIAGLQLAVDPATNKVTVTASGNPNLKNIADQDNYYDPATKTFVLNFAWYGGAPPPTGSSRQAHVTLTYNGSR
ncbi:BT_3044 domain-containing protein [Mucilaginibacter xinganensis]|uniref:BT-3044-like C-terminal domain-containing protein n=1 Tax=Mucilaginibacter xinganensis TaxID=1234841 RepID=A0A223NRL1_9SPHI|nr:DUF4361 domain-containing protein [Mucilaginibacter xinganensis]ASU32542.1 hypothetical protein MuYL_0639 [Mucilaginibacter xinganensis]